MTPLRVRASRALALVVLTLALPHPASAGHRVYALLAGNILIRFDSETPASTTSLGAVTGLGPNETIRGIDFRPRTGQLIATTVTTGAGANSLLRTYVVHPETAVATLIGATAAGLAGAADLPTGYDVNPTVDLIRYVNTNDENARVDPNDGALRANDSDLTPASTTDLIAAAYDRNFDRPPGDTVAIPTTLYVIDRIGGMLSILGGIDGAPSPNGGVVTDRASLGITLSPSLDGGFDIAPGTPETALAALTTTNDGLSRLYAIDLDGTASVATAIGIIGGGSEVRSIAIAPGPIQAVGADGRSTPQVRIIAGGAPLFDLQPYSPRFAGGVRVAVGDVNGDGVSDVVTGSGRKLFPHVRVFDGTTRLPLRSVLGSFVPFDASFTGGVFVAAGDLNGDGLDDVVVASDAGKTAQPHVRAFSGRTGAELASFLAYPAEFRGGVRVATGDVNGDGRADIITGTGPGGAAHVKVFSGIDGAVLRSFFPFEASFAGGVFVAAGDLDGDGRAEIVTGAGAGGGPHVKVFSGLDGSVLQDFQAFIDRAKGGVRVAVGDVNGDRLLDILVGFAPRVRSEVRAFDGRTLQQLQSLEVFEKARGVFVGG